MVSFNIGPLYFPENFPNYQKVSIIMNQSLHISKGDLSTDLNQKKFDIHVLSNSRNEFRFLI